MKTLVREIRDVPCCPPIRETKLCQRWRKKKEQEEKRRKKQRDGKQRDRERDPYFLVRHIKGEKNAVGERNLRDKTEAENFPCFNGWSCLQLTVHIATIWLHGQTIVGFFIPLKIKIEVGFFILLLKPKHSWTYICWGPKFLFFIFWVKWWSIY